MLNIVAPLTTGGCVHNLEDGLRGGACVCVSLIEGRRSKSYEQLTVRGYPQTELQKAADQSMTRKGERKATTAFA